MTGETSFLNLRVKPGAKRAGLLGWHGDALKIAVRAAPERGRANEEVLALLSATLGMTVAALHIVSGATARNKRLRVDGLAADELRRRLDEALAAG